MFSAATIELSHATSPAAASASGQRCPVAGVRQIHSCRRLKVGSGGHRGARPAAAACDSPSGRERTLRRAGLKRHYNDRRALPPVGNGCILVVATSTRVVMRCSLFSAGLATRQLPGPLSAY